MARQDSIMPFNGTVDNMTFLKTADGYRVRKKRRKADSISPRVQETMSKFGAAGTAGKLLRQAIRSLVIQCADSRATARLLSQMVEVINSDTSHDRAARTVADGNSVLLKGFDFNIKAPLDTVFYAVNRTTIDRVTGQVKLDVDPFIPVKSAAQPEGSTHFKLILAGVEVDFTGLETKADIKTSDFIPLSIDQQPALSLVAALPAASTHPLFAVVGIEYYSFDAGKYYQLAESTVNGLKIVEVSGS